MVSVWKTPLRSEDEHSYLTHQGIPQKTSAITSIVKLLANTKMKMKPVSATMDTIITIFGPKRSAAQPLTFRSAWRG